MGKLVCNYDELQFKDSEWQTADSRIKELITNDIFSYEPKGKDPIVASNISNFIASSNRKSIPDLSGRRVFCLDINTSKKGDDIYFDKLNKFIKNENVAKALFTYLNEVKIPYGWNSQDNMPRTEAKADAIVSSMSPVAKFLKYCFVLKNRSINKIKCNALYSEFVNYCKSQNIKYTLSMIQFYASIREYESQIKRVKSNGYSEYRATIDDLKKLATLLKWYHEDDNELLESQHLDLFIDDSPLDYNHDEQINLKKENESLKEQIEILKIKLMTKDIKNKMKFINKLNIFI
jgi:phage/plasmid-associated DNA primase